MIFCTFKALKVQMSNSFCSNGSLPQTINNIVNECEDFIEVLPTTRTVTRFPLKEIDSIQFGISSPEDIMKKGVCKIDSHKLSGPGSVYDPRMGAMENNETCVTCGKTASECAGHPGWVELNTFIIHPMFMRYVTNFLKCLCIKCYRVVLTEDHLNLDGVLKYHQDSRFEKIVDRLEKVDICYHCGSPKPKFVFQLKTSEITMCFDKKKVVISDTEIKKILENIPDEDVKLLGFNPEFMHPKNLILSVLEVIPPRARPYIIADNIACDDDLTTSLSEIIKANNVLADETTNASKKDKALQTLKFRIKTMMNNSQGKRTLPSKVSHSKDLGSFLG